MTTQLLTTAQASAALGIGAEHFRRLVRAGKIVPAATTPGGHGRFDAEAIAEVRRARRGDKAPSEAEAAS